MTKFAIASKRKLRHLITRRNWLSSACVRQRVLTPQSIEERCLNENYLSVPLCGKLSVAGGLCVNRTFDSTKCVCIRDSSFAE